MLLARLSDEVRAQQRANDVFDQAVVDRAGVNRTDGRVIDILQQYGPLSAGAWARAAALSTGAATTAVDRLVSRGLVRRRRDPADRRRVLVDITAKTAHLVGECFGPLVAEAAQELDRFTDDELAAIVEFVRLDRELHERHAARVARDRTGDGPNPTA
jgi:DNA-binding MarR family transcriptional regulator